MAGSHLFFTPTKRHSCCCEVPAPSSCPFFPNNPPRACPHGGCCPHPQLQPPGGSSFGLQRLRTPAPPPSHLALGVPGQDPPMSQLCCRVSADLSENKSPRGPIRKSVLREVTVYRDELFCSKAPGLLDECPWLS